MRWAFVVIVSTCCTALAVPSARAVDVVLGWDAATRWDSNVLNSSQNEQRDFSFRTGPVLDIHQQRGIVTGRLRWSSRWEGFLETDGVDRFDHFVDLNGAWRINERNQLRVSNTLAITDSLTSQLVVIDDTPAATGQDVEPGRDTTLRNSSNATFTHQVSPTLSLEAALDNSIFDFERDDRSDAISTRGSAQVVRSLSPRVGVGFGAAFTRQDFDDSSRQQGSGADIIELFAIWNYQISPTLVFSTRLGPSLNRPDDFDAFRFVPETPTIGSVLVDAASCPIRSDGFSAFAPGCQRAIARNPVTGAPLVVVVDGQPQSVPAVVAPGSVPLIEASFLTGAPETEDAITLFGAVSLVKQWERSSARFQLQRRSSAASGNGVSTDLTSATAAYTFKPAQKWTVTGIAGWTLQTSASDIPLTEIIVEPATLFVDENFRVVDDPALAVFRADGAAVSTGVREAGSTDNALESTTYQLQLIATHSISRRLTARGRVSLFRFESSGDFQSDRTTDSLRLELGLRWEFDPFRL